MAKGHVQTTRHHPTISPKEGGWELLDIEAKCRARLLSRVFVQVARPGTVMSAELHKLGLNECFTNPQNTSPYPKGLEHVRAYAVDMVYVPPPRSDDTTKLWRKRIY
jgi:hypothetical protein